MRKLQKISIKWDPAAVTLSVLACVAGLFAIWAAVAGIIDDNRNLSATAAVVSADSDAMLGSRGAGASMRSTNIDSVRAAGGLIAIVIDDLGGDPAATRRVLKLPPQVTLAFLPYPPNTPRLAAEGARGGHEIIAHVPMEAEKGAYPGLEALETVLTGGENAARLETSLNRVPKAIGINNHMGSQFTANEAALAPVMAVLRARGLFFFDSRTTKDTKVPEAAARAGVASAGRDVFLDDIRTDEAVRAELAKTEGLAREHGVAIAIGHPHKVTLDALEEWIGRNHARLIPLSEAMRLKIRAEQAKR